MLRTDDERLTSLFRASGGGVESRMLSRNMGSVESVCERASEPFDCEMAAEFGRDIVVWLESRDVDMLLDKRRSHD